MIDLVTALVAWLLMIFLQTCPADRLQAGETFTFELMPYNRRLIVSVDNNDAKHHLLTFTCGMLQESGKGLERTHTATMTWGKKKTVTSFKTETREELIAKPLELPLQPASRVLLGADPAYAFLRTKEKSRATPTNSVEGYQGKIQFRAAAYREQMDELDISTDAELGLLNATFLNAGETSGLQLVKVNLKRSDR
jgi:hypothetical protein